MTWDDVIAICEAQLTRYGTLSQAALRSAIAELKAARDREQTA